MPVPTTSHTHYKTLDLQPDATDDEIRVAYKKLALKWHPDRHQEDKEDAQKKFVEINDAYLKLVELRQRERKHKSRKPKETASEAPSSSFAPSFTPSDASSAAASQTDAASGPATGESKEGHPKEKSRRPPDPPDTKSNSPKPPKHSTTRLSNNGHATSTPSGSSSRTNSRSDQDDSSEDEEIHPKKPHASHKSPAHLEDTDYEFVDLVDLGSPLHPLRSPKTKDSVSKDWLFPLPLSLDDLYRGASHHYRITRTLRSGNTQSVKIDIKVSPSWKTGTRIRVSGVGNERRDGSFQDIVFVVEEKPHPMFSRVDDDLVFSVQVPWAESRTRPYPPSSDGHGHRGWDSSEDDEEVYFRALDGQEYALPIPRSLVEGADGTRIRRAGMPIRKHGKITGRGDLVVKWDFVFTDSERGHRAAWYSFKKAMHWKL